MEGMRKIKKFVTQARFEPSILRLQDKKTSSLETTCTVYAEGKIILKGM
jgi:hypothetical protein